MGIPATGFGTTAATALAAGKAVRPVKMGIAVILHKDRANLSLPLCKKQDP